MKAYAIKNPIGKYISVSFDSDKTETVDRFIHPDNHFIDRNVLEHPRWIEMEKQGYTCVPVEITEIKEQKCDHSTCYEDEGNFSKMSILQSNYFLIKELNK